MDASGSTLTSEIRRPFKLPQNCGAQLGKQHYRSSNSYTSARLREISSEVEAPGSGIAGHESWDDRQYQVVLSCDSLSLHQMSFSAFAEGTSAAGIAAGSLTWIRGHRPQSCFVETIPHGAPPAEATTFASFARLALKKHVEVLRHGLPRNILSSQTVSDLFW